MRNPCRGWKNGDPVTYVGSSGRVLALGTARVWTAKSTGRRTVKVQVTSPKPKGEWEWPDGWVLGQGEKAGVCLQCDQAYRTDAAKDSGFCPACDRDFQQEISADSGVRKARAYMHGARTPMPAVQPHTEEELAAIAAQKADDDKGSPF